MATIQSRIFLKFRCFNGCLLGRARKNGLGILHFLVTYLINIIQFKIAIGQNIPHILLNRRISNTKIINYLFRAFQDRLYIVRVAPKLSSSTAEAERATQQNMMLRNIFFNIQIIFYYRYKNINPHQSIRITK